MSNSPAAEAVALKLEQHGLHGPAFDVAAITADYAARIEMDAGLDALIGSDDVAGDRLFDPRDPR